MYQVVYLGIEQVNSLNYPLFDVQKKHFWELGESVRIQGLDYYHEMMTLFYSTEVSPPVSLDESIVKEVCSRVVVKDRCLMAILNGLHLM